MKNKTKILLLSIVEIIIFALCLAFSGTTLKFFMDRYGNLNLDVFWTIITVVGCALGAVLAMAIIAYFIIKLSKKADE